MSKILIVDFGGDEAMAFTQQIRMFNVYAEVVPFSKCMEAINEKRPSGMCFIGGDEESVNSENAPLLPFELFEMNIPILAIGYGMHVMAKVLGGKVEKHPSLQYSKNLCPSKNGMVFNVDVNSAFFENLDEKQFASSMEHAEHVVKMPEGFSRTAFAKGVDIAGMQNVEKKMYAFQFSFRYLMSPLKDEMIEYFLFDICKAKRSWKAEMFIPKIMQEIEDQVKDKKVLLALSGGVDSTVLSHLVYRVIGNRLTCVFVDTGLMRKGESEEIIERFENKGFRFIHVDAKERFLEALKGVVDPEKKRRVIGETYIRVFEDMAREIGDVDFLAQGTIYADVVESGALKDGKLVKSHHNVGGLPDIMDFKGIVEPFRCLFKEEVRKIGDMLGLPPCVVYRQPFPGPGLAVRIIGEVTKEKVAILQKADEIWRFAVEKHLDIRDIKQYFAVLLDMKTVGVRNGERTYGYTLALRAIKTDDFVQAISAFCSIHVYNEAIKQIEETIPEITRIVYDMSSKPPATIEWE